MLAEPVDKVDYMLVESSGSDLISEQYPGAEDGDVPFLEPVVSNDRYTLLRVVPSPAVETSLSP